MKNQISRYNEVLPRSFFADYKSAEVCDKTNFHLHDQLEFLYTMSDNLVLQTETETIPLPRDHILLLSSRDLHFLHWGKNTGVCNRYNLYFSQKLVASFSTPESNLLQCFNVRTGGRPNILPVPAEQRETFVSLLEQLAGSFHRDRPPADTMDAKLAEQYAQLLLGQLLILTNHLFNLQSLRLPTPTEVKHHVLAAEIGEFIQGRLWDALSVDMLARQFYVSKTQLYYLFMEVYGIGVSQYISELRITKAKDLLINSDSSVDDIAQSVGYQNMASFSRAFKTNTNFSPTGYRRVHTGVSGKRGSMERPEAAQD